MPVLFLLSGPKIGFCPDKREMWHGGADRAKFQKCGAEMWEYSPPNCQNF